MRTVAREIALRNCSKEVGEKDSIYVILQRGSTYNQAHLFLGGFY